MAVKKKPRPSRLSPGAKLKAKERRKDTLREYSQSRHIVRLSDSTWNEWNRLKEECKSATHDNFAERLLQAWTERISDKGSKETEKTPLKRRTEVAFHSTFPGPSFPVSDITESTGVSETEQSDDSVVTKLLDRAA